MSFLATSLFFVSCQKDDDQGSTLKESPKLKSSFSVERIDESKVNKNRELLDRLSGLSEKVEQSRLASANKSIYSSEDDFYINTDFATYLENNDTGYHSYTFPVFRTEQADGVENVLLSLQEDGSYKAFLVVYDLNDQELLDLQNELNVDLTDKTTIYSLEDDSFVDDIFGKVLVEGDCVGILMCPYEEDHPATQVCIDEDRGNLYLDTSMCDDNASGDDSSGGGSSSDGTSPGGGDPGSGTTGTGTTGGGQTNNGGSGGFGEPDSTIITIPQPWEEVVLCLSQISENGSNGFTFQMADWLQAQPKGLQGIINSFIEENGCNEEINPIVIDAISDLMSYDENNYPGKEDGYSYEWWLDEEFVEDNFSFELDDEGFGNLTKKEKKLVVLFPITALIIRDNKAPAELETQNRFNTNGRNDKSDAFRHGFFNAMNANDAGLGKANLFSDVHESENPINLIKEEQMDLFNNDVGLEIGDAASVFVSDQTLSNSVYQSLLNGELVYLSPLGPIVPPNFGITSSTQLIPTNQ